MLGLVGLVHWWMGEFVDWWIRGLENPGLIRARHVAPEGPADCSCQSEAARRDVKETVVA